MTQLGHLSCVYTLTSQGEGAKLRGQGARARPFIPGARHTHWDEHTQAGEPLPAGLGRRWSLFQRPPAPRQARIPPFSLPGKASAVAYLEHTRYPSKDCSGLSSSRKTFLGAPISPSIPKILLGFSKS